jgi:hypothetical protein
MCTDSVRLIFIYSNKFVREGLPLGYSRDDGQKATWVRKDT